MEAPLQTRATATEDSRIEALYTEHFDYLVNLARRKYDIPPDEAETLTHDVFLNYLRCNESVENDLAYLTIGLLRACGEYWRRRRREPSESQPTRSRSCPRSASEDALVKKLTVGAAVKLLRERCRRTLSLYFVEGCTAKEVASQVGTTRRYAEKLIRNCLVKLRGIYGEMVDH